MISFLRKDFPSYAKLAELIFFPSFCELCSSLLESPEERIICRSCWEGIKTTFPSYCLCCGRFFEGSGEPHLCQNCLKKRPPFSYQRSCTRYKGKFKDIIILLKYRHFQVLGKDLAQFVYRVLGEKDELWWGVEVMIPVPLHPKRKRQRGFNQAQLIVKELSRLKHIEIVEECLVKNRNTPPQTLLDEEEREKNVSGAFGIKKGENIKGKVVLLVDDVYTTGSTIRECSSVLKEAGAKEVRAITLAQA